MVHVFQIIINLKSLIIKFHVQLNNIQVIRDTTRLVAT